MTTTHTHHNVINTRLLKKTKILVDWKWFFGLRNKDVHEWTDKYRRKPVYNWFWISSDSFGLCNRLGVVHELRWQDKGGRWHWKCQPYTDFILLK